MLLRYFFYGEPPTENLIIIFSIWFIGGLILFAAGIIALYLSVMFIETKKRPYTIIRHIYERKTEKARDQDRP